MPSKRNRCSEKLKTSKRRSVHKDRSVKRLKKRSIRNKDGRRFDGVKQEVVGQKRKNTDDDVVYLKTETNNEILNDKFNNADIITIDDDIVEKPPNKKIKTTPILDSLYNKYKINFLNTTWPALTDEDLQTKDENNQTLLHFIADKDKIIFLSDENVENKLNDLTSSKQNFITISNMYRIKENLQKIVNMKDNDGETPLSLAIRNIHWSKMLNIENSNEKAIHLLKFFNFDKDVREHAFKIYKEIIPLKDRDDSLLRRLNPEPLPLSLVGYIASFFSST